MERELPEEELIKINKGLTENRIHEKGSRVITYAKPDNDYHSINDISANNLFSFNSPSAPYVPGFGDFTDLSVSTASNFDLTGFSLKAENKIEFGFDSPSANNVTSFEFDSPSASNVTGFEFNSPVDNKVTSINFTAGKKETVNFDPNFTDSLSFEILYGNIGAILYDNPETAFQGYFATTDTFDPTSFNPEPLTEYTPLTFDGTTANNIELNMFPSGEYKDTFTNWQNAIGEDKNLVYDYFYNMLSINKDAPNSRFNDSSKLQFTELPPSAFNMGTIIPSEGLGGLWGLHAVTGFVPLLTGMAHNAFNKMLSENEYIKHWVDNNEKNLKKRFAGLHPDLKEDSEEYKTAWETYLKEQTDAAKERYKKSVEDDEKVRTEEFKKAHIKWWKDNFGDGENNIWKQSLNSFTAGLINMANDYVSDLINGVLGRKGTKGKAFDYEKYLKSTGEAGTVLDLLDLSPIPLFKEKGLYKVEEFKAGKKAPSVKKINSSLRVLFNEKLGIKNESEAFIRMINDDPLLASHQFLLWTYKESNPGVVDKVYGFRLQGITIPEFSRKSQTTKYGLNILQLQAQENITVKNYADGEILCDKRLNSLRYLFDYLGIGVDEGASCPFVKDTFVEIKTSGVNAAPAVANEIFNISNIHDITLNVPEKNRMRAEDYGWIESDIGNMGRDLGELGTTAVLEIIPGSYIQREHNEIFGNRWNVHQPIEGMGKGIGQEDFDYQRTPYFVFENFRIYKASPQFNFRASSDSTSLMKVKVGFSWTKMSIDYRVFNGDIYAGKFGKDVNPELVQTPWDRMAQRVTKQGKYNPTFNANFQNT